MVDLSRQIKFRGKTKNGEWVEGYYVEMVGKGFIFGDKVISPEIFVSTKPPLSSIPFVEVDPATVGQIIRGKG